MLAQTTIWHLFFLSSVREKITLTPEMGDQKVSILVSKNSLTCELNKLLLCFPLCIHP